jgi:cytochrome P450
MNIYTCDPKNIQAILATRFQDFELGETRRQSFFPLLGNGIFTADGKEWYDLSPTSTLPVGRPDTDTVREHSRSMLRPQFSRQQVADLQLEEVHVQNLLKHLMLEDQHDQSWTTVVDVVPLFFRLTLDSATEFLFGQSVNSQIAALPDRDQSSLEEKNLDWTSFGPAFDAATADIATRSWLYEFFWLYNPQSFKKHCRDVHKFVDYYVNLALCSEVTSQEKTKDPQEPPRARYVFLHELVQQTRDPIELRSQLLNILLAGRDTTAGLLGWTFYLLARHPRVFKTLREVVIQTFGNGNGDNPKAITFESLKQCTYLQFTLSESLRLFATVPANSRRAVRDTTLPRGGGPDGTAPVFVKKDQEVGYSVHIMHHREDIWGGDVGEFKPERWTGRKPGWEFLPFNGGPRICLGQQFALTEAGYVIVRLLQTFDGLEMDPPIPSPQHKYSLTTSPARVPIRFHRAGGSVPPKA